MVPGGQTPSAFAGGGACSSARLCRPGERRGQKAPGGVAEIDPGKKLIVYEPISNLPRRERIVLDFEPERPGFVFKSKLGISPGPGCQQEVPETIVVCVTLPGGNVIRYVILLGRGKKRAVISPSVPKLEGPNRIKGGKGKNKVEGGRSDERVNTGKGKDEVDPGKGEDEVHAGAANDKVDTEDGKKDEVNCGKGERDVVEPDRKDSVKNCEIRRK